MRILFLILVCLLVSCGSSENIVSTEEGKVLDKLVAQKVFEIESDWAYPLATRSINSLVAGRLLPPGSTGSNINLIGNPNYVKVQKDSISMYLPYFGERQLAGGYNATNIGYEFKGIPEDFEITKDDKKQRYQIRFRFINKESNESCRVIVTLYPNLTSSIVINSTHRTTIRYKGVVSKLSKKTNKTITTN